MSFTVQTHRASRPDGHRAFCISQNRTPTGIYGPRVQWEQDRRGTHPGSGDRSQTPWSCPASGRRTSGRPSRSHRPRPAGPSHRTRRAGAAGSPGLRFDFLPSPVRQVPTPGFFTTCKPASFHAIQPPTSALAFLHPAFRSSRATRALVASSFQENDLLTPSVRGSCPSALYWIGSGRTRGSSGVAGPLARPEIPFRFALAAANAQHYPFSTSHSDVQCDRP